MLACSGRHDEDLAIVSQHLASIRSAESYLGVQQESKNVMNKRSITRKLQSLRYRNKHHRRRAGTFNVGCLL
jgi:hypothetical protein